MLNSTKGSIKGVVFIDHKESKCTAVTRKKVGLFAEDGASLLLGRLVHFLPLTFLSPQIYTFGSNSKELKYSMKVWDRFGLVRWSTPKVATV